MIIKVESIEEGAQRKVVYYGRPKWTKRAFLNISKSFPFLNIDKSFLDISKSWHFLISIIDFLILRNDY